MDFAKLQHPGWWGLIVPIGLALTATFTPDTVRGVLLLAMVGAVAWTVHHTEFAARRWKITSIAAGICAILAIPIFVAGHALDARQKRKELTPVAKLTPTPVPPPTRERQQQTSQLGALNGAKPGKKAKIRQLLAQKRPPNTSTPTPSGEVPSQNIPTTGQSASPVTPLIQNAPQGINIGPGASAPNATVINNGMSTFAMKQVYDSAFAYAREK